MLKRNLRERFFSIRHLFILYSIYVLFGGILYFALPHRPQKVETPPFLADFSSLSTGLDRVVLIADGEESIATRLNLIRNAEKSVEIAYHSLHKGVVAQVFYGALLEAADRGVQVRILMDGIFHR